MHHNIVFTCVTNSLITCFILSTHSQLSSDVTEAKKLFSTSISTLFENEYEMRIHIQIFSLWTFFYNRIKFIYMYILGKTFP